MTGNLILLLFSISVTVSIWWLLLRKEMQIKWYTAITIGIVPTILGSVFSKILGWMEVGFKGKLYESPTRLFGLILLLPIVYNIIGKILKVPKNKIMDIACLAVVVGIATGRIFCIIEGCCKGVYIGDLIIRWPIRELELVYYVIFFAKFYKSIKRKEYQGNIYAKFMISYGMIRFILEFFRDEYTFKVGFLHIAHIWSIVSIIAGIIWLKLIYKESKVLNKRKNIKHKRRK